MASAAPTQFPDYTPEPTPEGALPLRTEVQVNTHIVDRPGVPADLYDRYWWTSNGDAGQLGTTAQIGIPQLEQIITVTNGFVVTARERSAGDRLLVRDIRTGTLVRRIDTGFFYPRAVIVGRHLFWSGVPVANSNRDGGLWAVALDSAAEPIAVVSPGEDLSDLARESFSAGRTLLSVSPSGQTLGSVVSGWNGRFTDIVDVETLTVRKRLVGVAVAQVLDDTGMALDEPPTDAPQGWWKAVDLVTGATLWRFPTLDQRASHSLAAYNFEATGASFLTEFWRKGDASNDVTIALFDPRTGSRTRLLNQQLTDDGPRALRLVHPLVGTETLVLSVEGDLGELAYLGSRASVLDLEDGSITPDAFWIDTPWLCYPEYCLSD